MYLLNDQIKLVYFVRGKSKKYSMILEQIWYKKQNFKITIPFDLREIKSNSTLGVWGGECICKVNF